MNINKLNDSAVKELAQKIAERIVKMETDDLRTLLTDFCACMDNLDEDDFFGTEGWKHFFGVE